MLRALSLTLASALALSVAAPAYAQMRDRVRVVDVGDVDTYSARGADTAIRRIENASEEVCGVQGGAQPIPQRVYARECAIETREAAIANSGNNGIIARYYGYDPEITIAEGDAAYDDGYYVEKPKY